MATHTKIRNLESGQLTRDFDAGDIALLSDGEIDSIHEWMEDIRNEEPMLISISSQIAAEINKASSAGDYILTKSTEEIAEKIRSERAVVLPAKYSNGAETFRCFWSVTNLVNNDFFEDFPVMEGGSLISNSNTDDLECNDRYRSSHAIQIARYLPTVPMDGLVIITSRSAESKRACVRGGAAMLRRSYFPMLDALTCDPTCKPGSDGRQAGVGRIILKGVGNCIACPVNEVYSDGLIDSCYLLTTDVDRAYQLECSLADKFNNDAVIARQMLVGD